MRAAHLITLISTALVAPSITLASRPSPDPVMKKATAIITVDAVEPCLLFWTGLGFEVTVEVPHENAVGFAMLNNGDVEIMYQSRASIVADLEQSGAPEGFADELTRSTTTLFVEVEDLDAVLENIEDAEVLVPRRRTFYGMDEVFVRAPCGTVVGFAARAEGKAESN